MLFVRAKNKDYEVVYKKILSIYFEFLHRSNLNLTPIGISELLRYALCEALGLESISADPYIAINAFSLVQEFKVVLNFYDIYSKSIDYKQGLLEACIHCIEMSREKAGYAVQG